MFWSSRIFKRGNLIDFYFKFRSWGRGSYIINYYSGYCLVVLRVAGGNVVFNYIYMNFK